MEMEIYEKAFGLLERFSFDYRAVDVCTEEIIMALYDVGCVRPEFWYGVQGALQEMETAGVRVGDALEDFIKQKEV